MTATGRARGPVAPVRPKDRFLVFGAPALAEEDIQEVVASLRSGWLGTGPKVAQFERDFAAYRGASMRWPSTPAPRRCT